ncbi:nitrilase-related carbon-nitrogen hydrolase [Desulfovibrio legallii]|jgi:predicted amidohydrolase|uniref:Carbon-nitrogen hydrolase n=1 Tax=Desulfovibrio legallii TaxID=571438 RepID=A0A1G7QUX6_9BACT|nr:nitrilase-related carbon-nitrogen hydrolase [Desulfovibrio legallii]SDG02328.1 Carbon-nitrogen hydrolase [Desulfovibrio legallii]
MSHAADAVKFPSYRVAAVQMAPEIGAKEANIKKSLLKIQEAAAAGAVLIVLPELCNSGYVFNSREEAFALSESVPDGPTVTAWADAAQRLGVHVAAGICERAGACLYNAAVLVGPEGYIGTFRKVHLWGEGKMPLTSSAPIVAARSATSLLSGRASLWGRRAGRWPDRPPAAQKKSFMRR